jgi:hypothetical protein
MDSLELASNPLIIRRRELIVSPRKMYEGQRR